ncbi:MAG: GNAT family N-acetyltransferase [Oscillospiraceae bacterium]|nr:GNAT family N-acetyltransferase [Oscillospiraceae bacterium]
MELVIKRFEELTAEELYEILRLRVSVFVVEQNCPYQELDGKDLRAYHVYLRDAEGIEAYLRVLDAGVSFPEVSIGRVIAVKRRQGLGSRILSEGVRVAGERLAAGAIRIEAQTYARGLYEAQGFCQVSEEFLEDGIPHIEMLLRLRGDAGGKALPAKR